MNLKIDEYENDFEDQRKKRFSLAMKKQNQIPITLNSFSFEK